MVLKDLWARFLGPTCLAGVCNSPAQCHSDGECFKEVARKRNLEEQELLHQRESKSHRDTEESRRAEENTRERAALRQSVEAYCEKLIQEDQLMRDEEAAKLTQGERDEHAADNVRLPQGPRLKL